MTRTQMEHWLGNLTSDEAETCAAIILNDISEAAALNAMIEWAQMNGASDNLINAMEAE